MSARKNFLRTMLVFGIAVSSMLVSWQCIESPAAFVAPSSDVTLYVPIADITSYASDMFSKDTTSLKHSSLDGSYYFDDTQPGKPVGLDTLKAQASPSSNQVTLGAFTVPGLSPTTQQVTLSQLGLTAQDIPSGFPFPAASATAPGTTIDQTSQFDYVQIGSGTLTLTIQNNLPLRITFTQPLLLKNNKLTAPVDTSVVATFNLGLVDSFKTVTATANLAGKFLRGALKTGTLSFTTQARTGPFQLQASNGLVITFSSSTLVADSAAAVIPSQSIASINDSTITVDDSVNVEQGTFSGGLFQARITNNLGINVGVSMKFSNFVSTTALQDTFTIKSIISPHTVLSIPVKMDTIRLVNGTPAPVGTTMRFSAGIYTINSGTAKSTVTLNDYVKAEFIPQQPFIIKSITGKIKPTQMLVNSGASGANLGDAGTNFSGKFTFDSVRIAVDLGMTGGFPSKYSLKLFAKNTKTGVSGSLTLPPPLSTPTDTTIYPSVSNFAFERIQLGNTQGLNTFLSQFVPNFPDTFYVRGTVTVNPQFASSTIFDTTKLYTRVNVYFPVKMGLIGGQAKDSIALTKDEIPKDFTNSVKSGKLNIEIENRLPLQLVFKGKLVGKLPTDPPNAKNRVLLTIPTNTDSMLIRPATVDAGGTAIAPGYSGLSFQLASFGMAKNPALSPYNDAQLFNMADSLYIQFDLITSPGAPAVKIRDKDYIRTRISGSLIYTINKQ